MTWGDKLFITWLKKTFLKEKRHDQVPMSRTLAPSKEDILGAFLQVYDISPYTLFRSRWGLFNEPRNVEMYLIRHLRADTLVSIGAHFGLARYSSVNSVITRIGVLRNHKIGVLRNHNEHINHRIEKILSLLKKSQEVT